MNTLGDWTAMAAENVPRLIVAVWLSDTPLWEQPHCHDKKAGGDRRASNQRACQVSRSPGNRLLDMGRIVTAAGELDQWLIVQCCHPVGRCRVSSRWGRVADDPVSRVGCGP
ncbi:hypothetical protein [Micromonospora sp. NPDC003816]|uniref:hypothetical protein n=1 Tax=Micromonospora sp. NPDC003816 TaxID=3364224 RepID=UPI0036A2136F